MPEIMVCEITSNPADSETASVFEVQAYFNTSQSKSRKFLKLSQTTTTNARFAITKRRSFFTRLYWSETATNLIIKEPWIN